MNSNDHIMEIPKAIEVDEDAVVAWRIYAENWRTSAHSAGESSPLEGAVKQVRELVTASSDAESCLYNSVEALRCFFNQEPSAIDFGLDIFRKAISELPDSVKHRYGKGPQGAENLFKWYLVEMATFFQGNVPPHKIGKEDTMKSAAADASNIRFSCEEVIEAREAVLEKLENFQKARMDIIVLLAMLGRCHSLEFARLHRGEHIGDHAIITVNNMFDREHSFSPLWSKADFIGCCIMLCAYAKSLIEMLPADSQEKTLAKWKDGLDTFLHGGAGGNNVDDDFVVKVHAGRVLRNLEQGPRDEGSTELFSLRHWFF